MSGTGTEVQVAKLEYKKIKAENEKKKFEELAREIASNPISQTVDQMKAMNISEDMVARVQENLENDARENVRKIQGDVIYDSID